MNYDKRENEDENAEIKGLDKKERKRNSHNNRRNTTREEVEVNETKEVEYLQAQEILRLQLVSDKAETISEEKKKNEDQKKTDLRIQELEQSIASLDNELERFDIERMKGRTRQVVERMKTAFNRNEIIEIKAKNVLSKKTVNGFLKSTILWRKYLSTTVE